MTLIAPSFSVLAFATTTSLFSKAFFQIPWLAGVLDPLSLSVIARQWTGYGVDGLWGAMGSYLHY